MPTKGIPNRNSTMIACPVCAVSLLPRSDALKNGLYACTCENCGHFFKFRAIQDFKSSISFSVNGTQYTVGNEYNPASSLADFLRYSGVSAGTKGSCYEGGCGVCLVTVKLYEPVSKQKVEYAVNSCCLQLFTCDGFEITTVEGLGNPKKGLHVIQERLAEHDGVQCGFCSPGQVMNMYSLLKENPTLTVQQIEDEFDATICRCTGYRAILDAMKTFAVDAPHNLRGQIVDIEELDAKLCKKTGKSCKGQCQKNGLGSHDCGNQTPRSVRIVGSTAQWLKPANLSELQQFLSQYSASNYRLVFGNTGFGLFQEIGPWNYDVLIDIRGIQELYTVNLSPLIVLGANLSLRNLIDIFDSKTTDPTVPYAAAFVEHLKITAQSGIRNMSSWAGNLMLKRYHPEFPSDIFLLFETVSARINIISGDGSQKIYNLLDFLNLDMKGKVIVSLLLPTYSSATVQIRTLKTSRRLQASQAYVNAGFNFDVDAGKNYLVRGRPTIVIQGINSTTTHAKQTEAFLENKALGDPAVLQGAFATLSSELVPEAYPTWSSPAYRKSLAISLFYKFVLDICQTKADARYVSGGQGLVRTPIVGTHDYDTDKTKWPLTEPIPKFTAPYLASGVVQFLDDLPLIPGELFASPVISTEGSAIINTVDASEALSLPGVVAFIQASDIPKGGVNNWRPVGIFGADFKEELLSTGRILYAGQPIGIIVADRETTAQTGAALVKVTYKSVQTPVVDIQVAIKNKAFFPNPPPPVIAGDAAAAIAAAPHKISGKIACGSQYQFHLEAQTTICTPTDVGGMNVKATTQWIDGVLETVAQVLGLQQSDVTVEVERLGGAFGGKITQNFLVSGLCALAAFVVGRTVKMRLDIHTNMKMLAKRTPYYAEYQVGTDNNGKLAGVIIDMYGDVGWGLSNQETTLYVQEWFDNAYYCANWLFTPIPVKTDKPVNTGCRAPGSAPFIFTMESIMEHLAKSLGLDPLAVRQLNLYTKGQKNPVGMPLDYCNIREIVSSLVTDIKLEERKAAINKFNKSNRWKKRGISVMPMRFAIMWSGDQFNSHVIVHHGDGSVSVVHAGIDVGQGINTKIIQVCAYELGIPMSKIRVKGSNSNMNANSYTTGGSVTAELCCMGVIAACKILKDRMAPVKAKMVNASWEDLVTQCYNELIDLTASYSTHPSDPFPAHYSSYSATCVEAEVDVLTGQYQIRQLDMLYDCGDSMNPELDIGQVEGGFAMGLGYFLQEEIKYDPQNGQVLTSGTWEYKPPLPKDLPMNLNFKFLKNAPNPIGILGSKAVGEPPVVTAASCLFAIKHAVEAARAETGQDVFFALDAPATVDKVQTLCLNNMTDYTYGK